MYGGSGDGEAEDGGREGEAEGGCGDGDGERLGEGEAGGGRGEGEAGGGLIVPSSVLCELRWSFCKSARNSFASQALVPARAISQPGPPSPWCV